MSKIKNLVIIPARGGSKRLPGKNLYLLNGIPLLVHSINYAKANKELIDKIVVSTDNPEIKEVAIGEGVEVIDRPEELSTDTSSTVSALSHVLENLNEPVENVILLQPTNPLRPKHLLKEALLQFETERCTSLMTVNRNRQKLGKIIRKEYVPFNYKIGERTQDLEPLYFENGLLYIAKAELVKMGILIDNRSFPMIVDTVFGEIDIDTHEDMNYAEYLIKNTKY